MIEFLHIHTRFNFFRNKSKKSNMRKIVSYILSFDDANLDEMFLKCNFFTDYLRKS